MDQLDLLRGVVDVLERLGIAYAVVGSFASGAWGEPRMTNDIDIVVDLDPFDVAVLIQAFPAPEFYVSETAAREAIESQSQFNLVHPASGNKIDFMIVGRSAWSRQQLQRAHIAPLLENQELKVAAPEDVILGKLVYYREGASEKHLRDITGILIADIVEINRAYIEHHATELGVLEEWQSIVRKLREQEEGEP